MIFDKIFTNKFLEELQRLANTRDGTSNTTYSIVYNLIREKKIVIYFNTGIAEINSNPPDAKFSQIIKSGVKDLGNYKFKYKDNADRDRNFQLSKIPYAAQGAKALGRTADAATRLVTSPTRLLNWNTDVKVKGGYDPRNGKIKFIVWFYIGVEWEKIIFRKIFAKVYSSILAALLHEGMLLYNLKGNATAYDKNLENWYKLYFSKTIMEMTRRTEIARFCGNFLGEMWPRYMYDSFEKYTIMGQEPPIKEKNIVNKRTAFITRQPLIKDYFKKPFKLLLGKELPERYDLDVDSSEDITAYVSDFIDFAVFMYMNRNKSFSLGDLKRVPKFETMSSYTRSTNDDGEHSYKTKYNWTTKCLGFEIVGDSANFDEAYDQIYDIKDPYSSKEFNRYFKKSYIFSEIFMPSEVQAKVVYFSVLNNVIDEDSIRLIDCATKGLSTL